MFRRRLSFPLDRVLAEPFEPSLLYPPSPPAPRTEPATGPGRVLESEHHLSHLNDRSGSREEWTLLGDWSTPPAA